MIDFNEAPASSGTTKKGWNKNERQYETPNQNQGFSQPNSPSPFVLALNPSQREAVEITEGPLLVLAGAGSGKTKMLTSRIAYLIERKGIAPYQILAVTFTNKAAAEMRERVEHCLGDSPYLILPEIGTFHSVCVRILRREIAHTPFKKPFVIYDDSDQLSLIKTVIRKIGLDEKRYSPKALQGAINRLKCDATEPTHLNPENHQLFDRQLKAVYEQYQTDLFESQALDFGEILCMTYRLFRDNPEVRKKYQDRYRYIHVDEYQDTNRVQYLLLTLLASATHGGHENLCVVGDEDQSIYKWRGADIRNILDFEKDYAGAKIVKLEQNYRSTKNIITAASHLIRNNRERKDKTLWTDNQKGDLIIAARLPDERAEAELVISEIKRLSESDSLAFKDFAVFYRTHAQSRQFEDVLRREKIPYQIVGGLRFYDRKEIKDILAYFKVILNTSDSVSLKRILNVPVRGIGKTTVEKLESLGGSLWNALHQATQDPSILGNGPTKKIHLFTTLINKLISLQPQKNLTELYHALLDETGYVQDLRKEGTEEALARIENLEEFHNLLQEFEEQPMDLEALSHDPAQKVSKVSNDRLLSLFLEQSTLASDADSQKNLLSSINLMTLHSSKGLEFPVVFLVGMEEGLFPSLRPWETPDEEEIEEERRLCYVGMTRARQKLYLSHVAIRRIWGNVSYQEPARFFGEIPDELIEVKDFNTGAMTSSFRLGSAKHHGWEQPSRVTPATPIVHSRGLSGRTLDHPEYGRGRIISQEGSGNDEKVWVEFRGHDKRKFLLRYLKGYLE